MISGQSHIARLLPWSTPEGKPCFLSSDGAGYLSRVADNIESVQLGMAGELLDHAADMLSDGKVTIDQLHFLTRRLTEALRDVKRVAESRGARLPAPDDDPDVMDGQADSDHNDGDSDGPQLPAESFG